ncbi:PA0069 family radical SAM protein [Aquisphaera insulae]|uniref:PA0069 family radical SAM protein n=1 Tax=Aquisphaera insulae TaxID=2712864 RepID=UPI0013EBE4F3|nr:PA0069 family radical SAM protein [Aquisphaera insulae]
MTRDDHPLAAGRGARVNPPNRFERTHHELDLSELDSDDDADYIASLGRPPTTFIPDHSRTILCRNDSPDVGFEVSINPYRGCEHGCVYCYARPGHEYLGYSAGLDFETRILVKHDAPELLRRELMKPSYAPKVLALSGVTDAYQPAERRLRLTRRCLEVLAEFRHAVGIVTKNRLVVRDLDLLRELASHGAAGVMLSVTTLDPGLARDLEPRTSPPAARLEAIRSLAAAGVPVGVMVAPVIPGLTDHEMPAILEAAAGAGATIAGYVVLRLPMAVAPLFEDWLERHRPAVKDRVLGRIRALRDGRLNDPRFGSRMRGEGPLAELIHRVFHVACRRHGLNRERWSVSPSAFRRPEGSGAGRQLRLFE